MSEPNTVVSRIDEVTRGVLHWRLQDDRIGGHTSAHAVATSGGAVLIDPLPLVDDPLEQLAPVEAICLTAQCHLMCEDGRLDFVPLEYHDDPPVARSSVEGLLDLDFEILCFDHGTPIAEDPKPAVRELLERTSGKASGGRLVLDHEDELVELAE